MNEKYTYKWSVKKEKSGWTYTNHLFPLNVLNLTTNDDIFLLLRTFGDSHCTFDHDYCEATTGTSGIGAWEEGDIDFVGLDGRLRTLSYDFIPIDEDLGQVFRYVVYDNE